MSFTSFQQPIKHWNHTTPGNFLEQKADTTEINQLTQPVSFINYHFNGPSSLEMISQYVLHWPQRQIQLHKPSEYHTCLVFKYSKVVRLANGPVIKCHLNTVPICPVLGCLCCMITILMLQYCYSYLVQFKIRTSYQIVQPLKC